MQKQITVKPCWQCNNRKYKYRLNNSHVWCDKAKQGNGGWLGRKWDLAVNRGLDDEFYCKFWERRIVK